MIAEERPLRRIALDQNGAAAFPRSRKDGGGLTGGFARRFHGKSPIALPSHPRR
jgi:hypothetical protein